MTCSKLTDAWLPVPGKSYSPRAYPVTRVTVHHIAGDPTIEGLQDVFLVPGRQASSNYGVGSDGRIGCYVDEENAAWTSASYWNDNQAITIEVADQDTVNWVPSEAAYNSTVALCADICNRYGIYPTYTGDTSGTFTEHMMFQATGCPGPWWHAHMPQFINDVKAAMEGDEVTPQDKIDIANLCAEKWAESAYWDEDKKAQWGAAGKGTGSYIRNNYNAARMTHDEIVAVANSVKSLAAKVDALSAKVDKIQVGTTSLTQADIDAISKKVNDDQAKRMQS